MAETSPLEDTPDMEAKFRLPMSHIHLIDDFFHPAITGQPSPAPDQGVNSAGPSPFIRPVMNALPAPPPIRPQEPNLRTPAPLSTPISPPEAPNVKPPAPAAAAPVGPRPFEDPAMAAHQANLNRLLSEPSGVAGLGRNLHGAPKVLATAGRIPLQILDAIGQGFFPRFEAALPGTEGHHRALIQGAQGVVKEDTAQRAEQAKEKLEGAQAEKDLNPAAKEPTNEFEQWRRQNPNAPVEDWLKLQAANKPERQGGTVHEDSEGNMWVVSQDGTAKAVTAAGAQIKGKTPEQKQGTVHQDAEGNMWIVHGDGTATPVTAKGEQLKGKEPAEKVPNEYADFRTGYLKKHAGASEDEIAAAYKRLQPAERPQPAPIVMVPGPNGTMVPTQSHLGTPLPTGTVTPGGMSSENVGANKAEAAETKARAGMQHEYTLAQELAATPSPTNDLALVMRYLGATKPDAIGKLRLNNNEIKLVYGTRSSLGDVEALISKIASGKSLTPQQRTDMLGTMKLLAGTGETAQTGAGGGAMTVKLPSGKTIEIK